MALNKEKLREAALLGLIGGTAALLFWELRAFVSPVLGAVVLFILLHPLQHLLEDRFRIPSAAAAIIGMLFSFLVLGVPLLLLSVMLGSKIGYLQEHFSEWVMAAQQLLKSLESRLGIEQGSAGDALSRLAQNLAGALPGLIKATAAAFTDFVVMYFVLYFLLTGGRETENRLASWLPFSEENRKLLLSELRQMTRLNALGSPMVALIQGLLSLPAYSIAGVDEAWFWAVLTALFSFIPLAGTAIIWLPLGAVMLWQSGGWQAWFLLGFGALIITNSDNLIRFWLQKRMGNIHPLVSFFGVVVGLDLFGVVGLVFGPLLISYLFLFLKIYRREYA